jgi:hypothetical protein
MDLTFIRLQPDSLPAHPQTVLHSGARQPALRRGTAHSEFLETSLAWNVPYLDPSPRNLVQLALLRARLLCALHSSPCATIITQLGNSERFGTYRSQEMAYLGETDVWLGKPCFK